MDIQTGELAGIKDCIATFPSVRALHPADVDHAGVIGTKLFDSLPVNTSKVPEVVTTVGANADGHRCRLPLHR